MARVTFDQYHPQWGNVYSTILQQKRMRYRNRNGRWPEQNYSFLGIAAQIESEAAAEATEAIRQMRTIQK